MAIEFNGKKVTKIMLGDKELLTAGTEGMTLDEMLTWVFGIKKDYVRVFSSEKIINKPGGTYYPEVTVPSSKRNVVFTKVADEVSGFYIDYFFYDNDHSTLIKTQTHVGNPDIATVKIPNGAKFFEWSTRAGKAMVKFI